MLDKQKILSELDSVVNQLQSADCGCMGKLFSPAAKNNNNMAMTAAGGCCKSGGCCHGHSCRGCNVPCAGEPYHGPHHCMGTCNPPKLYADTYSYLKKNYMQPVVNEVYNDLKSLGPNNTVANNPMAAQMGLIPNSGPMAGGNMGMNPCQASGRPAMPMQNNMAQNNAPPNMFHTNAQKEYSFNQQSMGQNQNQQLMGYNQQPMGFNRQPMGFNRQPMGYNQQPMGYNQQPMGYNQQPMGYNQQPMGQNQQLMRQNQQMMGHNQQQMGYNQRQIGHNQQQMGHNQQQMGHNQQQMGQNQQPMGQNQQQMGYNQHGMAGMGPQIINMMGGDGSVPQMGNPSQSPNIKGNMGQGNSLGGANIALKENMNAGRNSGYYNGDQAAMYGMNTNNLSPGNQGMPKNLYNMGSNNQQTNQSNELYPHTKERIYGNFTNPSQQQLTRNNINYNNMNQPQQQISRNNINTNMNQPQQQIPRNNYGPHSTGMAKFNEMFPGVMQGDLGFDPMAIAIQMNPENNTKAAADAMQKMLNSPGGIHKHMDSNNVHMQAVQNAANAVTAQLANQQQPNYVTGDQNVMSLQHNQQYQPQMIDPNRNDLPVRDLPTVYEDSSDMQQMPPTQQHHKEPILPADTSKNQPPPMIAKSQKQYYYNTVGQPVEMVPADIYRMETPGLPQTLSPQPTTKPNYSNVKYTESKTAIAGQKAIGRAPSRSQLNNLYNQYKGSQSHTQQNIQNPSRGPTHSEGNLNAPQTIGRQAVPIEKVVGDTNANNQIKNTVINNEKVIENIGDGKNPLAEGDKPIPSKKTRNGLQDMVFTSYPTSAAWSFHGTNKH